MAPYSLQGPGKISLPRQNPIDMDNRTMDLHLKSEYISFSEGGGVLLRIIKPLHLRHGERSFLDFSNRLQ